MQYVLLLLLVSYRQVSAGSEVVGLTDEQMTTLRNNIVKDSVIDMLNGAFSVVSAETGLTEHVTCAVDTYSVDGNVITKQVTPKGVKVKPGKPEPPPPPVFTMIEVEKGVLEATISGRDKDVSRLYMVHASQNVLAFVDCQKNEDHSEKKHKRPLVMSFIQVRKGKNIGDADVKGCYEAAKAKMEELGTGITGSMAMMKELC